MKTTTKSIAMNEHIANLTEAEAKLMLQFAMQDLWAVIYTPHGATDAARLGWLMQKIETLSKENTTHP
jgi:hypothetical protein